MAGDPSGVELALRWLSRLFQVVLVGIVGYAVVTANGRLFVNSVLPLGISVVPDVLRYRYGYHVNPVLGLWITAAATIHAVGILGPYKQFPWYDQVAHGVSASLIAGTGYASVRAIEVGHDDVTLPAELRFVFVLVVGGGIGVVWEIGEFALGELSRITGGQALLIQFGLGDAVTDLATNIVGAALVGLFATRYFDDLRTVLRDRFVDSTS